jgi:hypothetical protein
MKRTLATLAFASVLLSSAAYAQSVGEKTGVNSTLGIAPKTEDFIKEAAMSDMLEIEAAKIAQTKGDAQEKTFAGEMITDHTKTSTELKSMVSGEMKAALPTALDDSRKRSLASFVIASLRTSRLNMIRCRSALTRTRFRFSSVTPRVARTQSSKTGRVKPCRRCNTIWQWPRT